MNLGKEPIIFYRREVSKVDNGKNILTSKTAWVFFILLVFGALEATGVVNFQLSDAEAEGVALGIVAVIGLVLRLATNQPVHILPVK